MAADYAIVTPDDMRRMMDDLQRLRAEVRRLERRLGPNVPGLTWVMTGVLSGPLDPGGVAEFVLHRPYKSGGMGPAFDPSNGHADVAKVVDADLLEDTIGEDDTDGKRNIAVGWAGHLTDDGEDIDDAEPRWVLLSAKCP